MEDHHQIRTLHLEHDLVGDKESILAVRAPCRCELLVLHCPRVPGRPLPHDGVHAGQSTLDHGHGAVVLIPGVGHPIEMPLDESDLAVDKSTADHHSGSPASAFGFGGRCTGRGAGEMP